MDTQLCNQLNCELLKNPKWFQSQIKNGIFEKFAFLWTNSFNFVKFLILLEIRCDDAGIIIYYLFIYYL